MNRPVRIAAFASSNRRGSLNRRLLDRAVDAIAHVAGEGVEVDVVDLRQYPFPLYDADLQARDGLPAAVIALAERFAAADAVLVANPEYNGGYPALFKNTVDWLSRHDMFLFHPKYVGLLTTTPGGGGGVRGIEQTRTLFHNMFVTVHDEAFTLPKGNEALGDEGWNDTAHADRMATWAGEFVDSAIAHAEAKAAEADS